MSESMAYCPIEESLLIGFCEICEGLEGKGGMCSGWQLSQRL